MYLTFQTHPSLLTGFPALPRNLLTGSQAFNWFPGSAWEPMSRGSASFLDARKYSNPCRSAPPPVSEVEEYQPPRGVFLQELYK